MKTDVNRRYFLQLHPPVFPFSYPPDARGILNGPDYRPFIRAGQRNMSSQSANFNFFSRKNGRMVSCLSKGEFWVAHLLEMYPWVLGYREQYPWLSAKLIARLLEDPDTLLPRNQVMTIDFLMTLKASAGELKYVGISYKRETKQFETAAAQRRLQREAKALASEDWGFAPPVSMDALDATEFQSAYDLYGWIGPNLDLNELHPEMRLVAERMVYFDEGQALDDLCDDVADALHIPQGFVYQLFSGAVCMGFLTIDMKQPLRPDLPLHVLYDVHV